MSESARETPLDRSRTARLLREHGITPTHQRVEIAAALLAHPQHLCAEDLLSRVRVLGTRVSKATVYNTLRLLVERDLVREVIVDPARVFYDSNPDPHHHVYDLDRGTLTDIDAAEVRVEGLPSFPSGILVEAVDVVVRVRHRDPAID